MILRLLLAIVVAFSAACGPSRLAPERAIVVLVSIDGWRWDYIERFQPPALTRLAGEGVRAEGLIPQFPSKTFPNHYTIVTGLRLAHHGIVSNNMESPDVPGRFAMGNREVLADPRWWGGEPIWNTVEKQGRVAAAMFWPGSETLIGGRRATYWKPFDDKLPNADRVTQVLDWLKLPEGKRPSFLTLYFSDVDSAGHSGGPDSDEVRQAALRVDQSIGQLVAGVEAAGLADRVNYVVVSDHGMAQIPSGNLIVLDDYVDPKTVTVVDWAPLLGLSAKNGDNEALYRALKDKHPALAVYRNKELPAKYQLAGNSRMPAVIGIAKEGWFITSRGEEDRWARPGRHAPGGTHGYDVENKSMQGLFIANGPSFARGKVVPPFENIHVYDLLCRALGLIPAPNDGDPAVTAAIFR
ncbi:MAG: ectonucleotide pyrophosphatase/phosphodiesterase [Vicinamibacterales bacterium]